MFHFSMLKCDVFSCHTQKSMAEAMLFPCKCFKNAFLRPLCQTDYACCVGWVPTGIFANSAFKASGVATDETMISRMTAVK